MLALLQKQRCKRILDASTCSTRSPYLLRWGRRCWKNTPPLIQTRRCILPLHPHWAPPSSPSGWSWSPALRSHCDHKECRFQTRPGLWISVWSWSGVSTQLRGSRCRPGTHTSGRRFLPGPLWCCGRSQKMGLRQDLRHSSRVWKEDGILPPPVRMKNWQMSFSVSIKDIFTHPFIKWPQDGRHC